MFFKSNGFKKNKPLLPHNLDKKLVLNARPNFLPSWRQYKYILRFLGPAEKKIINICSLIIFLAGLSWLAIAIFAHLGTAPKSGGEYVEAMVGQPKLVNPLFSTVNDVDMDLVAFVYSGLFHYNEDQKFVPDLAHSWKLSDDKKIYEISLRQDVKWSDGEPFTADDVIFTFEAIQNPEIGSPLFPTFQGIKVEKDNDYTVRFMLKEPFAPFLESLTVGIMPEHIWSNITPGNVKLAKNNLQPIGTGPFVFSKLVKDDFGNIQNYVLERNNNYYGVLPYLQTLTFKFFNDYTQASDAIRSQNALAISFIPRNLRDKISKNNFNIYNFQMPQYTALFFNQVQKPILKNNDLRSALAKAINKQVILQTALTNEGEIVDAPILPGATGYYPEVAKIGYNLEEASTLLDKTWNRIQPEEYFKLEKENIMKERELEFKEIIKNASTTPETASSSYSALEKEIEDSIRAGMSMEQTYYRQNKDKNFLRLEITTVDNDEYARVADAVAKMWRAIGIQTNVLQVSSRQITREVLRGRNYEILLYGEVVGNDPDLFPFWHSSQTEFPGLNLSMFASREADKILEDARSATDEKARGELYKKFQNILAKEIPAIFLYSPAHSYVADKSLKGIVLNRISTPPDRYNGLANWYLKTKWVWK